MFGSEALTRFLEYDWNSCLDIGAGKGIHADYMRNEGRKVTTLDSNPVYNPNIIAQYLRWRNNAYLPAYEAIWCCHVLEHQINVGSFLRKIHNDLEPGGYLAITVPPAKHEIVGGHVTLWNPGLLVYNLILAGFDCANARVGSYEYNISVIVQKESYESRGIPIEISKKLINDAGDIELLSSFFPKNLHMRQGTDGRFPNIRW